MFSASFMSSAKDLEPFLGPVVANTLFPNIFSRAFGTVYKNLPFNLKLRVGFMVSPAKKDRQVPYL